MGDDAPTERSSEIARRAFLKRMVAVGFAVPVVTTFELSDAAAHHKDKHKNTTSSTSSTSSSSTTAAPTTTQPPQTTAAPTTTQPPQTTALPTTTGIPTPPPTTSPGATVRAAFNAASGR